MAHANSKQKPLTSAARGKTALVTLEMHINSTGAMKSHKCTGKKDSFVAYCFEFIEDFAQIPIKHWQLIMSKICAWSFSELT